MKTSILFFLFSLFCCNTFLAQTVVQGTIKNEQHEPLAGAVIACLSNADNKLQRGATTDTNGKFEIEVNIDKEWIRISYLGYINQDFTHPAEIPDEIIMKPANVELGEVVVQGKSIVTQKADRLVFSIANSNIVKGNNTMQLLRFTPLMRMENDQISMLGKSSMQLYINGKKSNMSGDAMQSYLRSLPAEKVEGIELITDPGSEYRAESNEGILNLILKKDEKQGWKGVLALNDKQGYYNSYNGNLFLDYQKEKFALSFNGYGNKNRENYQENTRYDYISESLSNQINQITRLDHRMGGGNINMDYQIAHNQHIGMMADVFYARRHDNIYSNTDYSQFNSSSSDSATYSKNMGLNTQFILTTNLNYRWTTDDKGSKFSADFDYLHTDNDGKSPMEYTYTKHQNDSRFTQNTDEAFHTYVGKIEYLHIFNPSNRLTVGTEGYYTNSKRDFFYGNYSKGEYQSDLQKSNSFALDEHYLAFYATYRRVWSPKFISTLGFRGEYMDRQSKQNTSQLKVDRHDFSALPTLTLIYRPNNNNQFFYSLNSRMMYPSFTRLNPFRYYISSTVYRENDPNIENVQAFMQTLRYVLKQHYVFSLNYINSKGINTFSTPVEGGYTRISARTFGRGHILQGIFNWNDSFWDNRLYLNASLNGMYNRSYGHFDEYKINISSFSYSGSLDFGIQLSKRYHWNLEGSANYNSKVALAQETVGDKYHVNIGLRKQFNNGIALRINGNYLLHNSNTERYLETEDYNFYKKADYHFRDFSIGITIPFGKKKVEGVGRYEGSSSAIKKRLKD